MRDNDNPKGERGSDDDTAGKRRDERRRNSHRSRRGGHGQGPEMPFQMGTFMQMLPLLMAMGGNMPGMNPGMNMVGTQLRLAMMMIEIWIDYMAAMQEFMERTLDRLAEFSDGGGLFGADDDGEDGKDW